MDSEHFIQTPTIWQITFDWLLLWDLWINVWVRVKIDLLIKFLFTFRFISLSFTRERINQGSVEINRKYGGLNPMVENVLFVNGELDPHANLQVSSPLNSNTILVTIPGKGTSFDLYLRSIWHNLFILDYRTRSNLWSRSSYWRKLTSSNSCQGRNYINNWRSFI